MANKSRCYIISINILTSESGKRLQHQFTFEDLFASFAYLQVFTTFTTILISLFPHKIDGIRAGCECVVFDDTYNKEYGEFTSPNYPTQYDDNIDCLLYTFIAKSEQIVKLTFVSFDLQKSSSANCTSGDFVKLFLNLEKGITGVNEHTESSAILCGKTLVQSELTHFSVGSILVFEFHTDSITNNNTGFSGTYQFINKSDFQSEGQLLSGTECDYQFVRISMNDKTSGKFYSPNYPSKYPKNINCAYHFFAKYNEKVKVLFESIQLNNNDVSCRYSSDVILVYDGRDANSPLIAQLCNQQSYVQIISTGPDLFMKFVTGPTPPLYNGFKASYLFESNQTNLHLRSSVTTSTLSPIKKDKEENVQIPRTEPDEDLLHKDETTESTRTSDCDQWIDSSTVKNGTFTSPNYPEPYPSNLLCTYHFTGHGKERIQILFTDFDLHLPKDDGPVRDCEGVDAVMVFITINGHKERIDNFCGNQLPSQLMSNGPSMSVEFHTTQSSSNVKGFRAIYRFITNFGISGGIQDPQTVCGFFFNSTTHPNGSFTSPNYPGLYPRDTECHYFFFGQLSERVHITFAYFDVEGVPPCDSSTASDFLEFSNYKTVDRKMARHCGVKAPKNIRSDNEFFRIEFKSNDKFDGTGFEAFYQFRQHEDTNNAIQKISTFASSCALNFFHSLSTFSTIFFIILINRCLNRALIIN